MHPADQAPPALLPGQARVHDHADGHGGGQADHQHGDEEGRQTEGELKHIAQDDR